MLFRSNGKDVLKMSKRQLRGLRGAEISMIFQDPMTSLNPVMTVGDQISEVLKIHNPDMTKQQRDERVAELLTLVGIPPERSKQEKPAIHTVEDGHYIKCHLFENEVSK